MEPVLSRETTTMPKPVKSHRGIILDKKLKCPQLTSTTGEVSSPEDIISSGRIQILIEQLAVCLDTPITILKYSERLGPLSNNAQLEFLNTHIPYLEYIIFEIRQFLEIFKTHLDHRYESNRPYYNLHFTDPLETLEKVKTHVEKVHVSKRSAIGLVSFGVFKKQQGKITHDNTQIQKDKETKFRTRYEELLKERGEEQKALLDSKLELLIATTNKERDINIKIESQILKNDHDKLLKLNTPIWLHRDFKEHYKTNIETSHAALDRLFKIQTKMWATTFETAYPKNETFLETPKINDKIEKIKTNTQSISDKIDEKIASIISLYKTREYDILQENHKANLRDSIFHVGDLPDNLVLLAIRKFTPPEPTPTEKIAERFIQYIERHSYEKLNYGPEGLIMYVDGVADYEDYDDAAGVEECKDSTTEMTDPEFKPYQTIYKIIKPDTKDMWERMCLIRIKGTDEEQAALIEEQAIKRNERLRKQEQKYQKHIEAETTKRELAVLQERFSHIIKETATSQLSTLDEPETRTSEAKDMEDVVDAVSVRRSTQAASFASDKSKTDTPSESKVAVEYDTGIDTDSDTESGKKSKASKKRKERKERKEITETRERLRVVESDTVSKREFPTIKGNVLSLREPKIYLKRVQIEEEQTEEEQKQTEEQIEKEALKQIEEDRLKRNEEETYKHIMLLIISLVSQNYPNPSLKVDLSSGFAQDEPERSDSDDLITHDISGASGSASGSASSSASSGASSDSILRHLPIVESSEHILIRDLHNTNRLFSNILSTIIKSSKSVILNKVEHIVPLLIIKYVEDTQSLIIKTQTKEFTNNGKTAKIYQYVRYDLKTDIISFTLQEDSDDKNKFIYTTEYAVIQPYEPNETRKIIINPVSYNEFKKIKPIYRTVKIEKCLDVSSHVNIFKFLNEANLSSKINVDTPLEKIREKMDEFERNYPYVSNTTIPTTAAQKLIIAKFHNLIPIVESEDTLKKHIETLTQWRNDYSVYKKDKTLKPIELVNDRFEMQNIGQPILSKKYHKILQRYQDYDTEQIVFKTVTNKRFKIARDTKGIPIKKKNGELKTESYMSSDINAVNYGINHAYLVSNILNYNTYSKAVTSEKLCLNNSNISEFTSFVHSFKSCVFSTISLFWQIMDYIKGVSRTTTTETAEASSGVVSGVVSGVSLRRGVKSADSGVVLRRGVEAVDSSPQMMPLIIDFNFNLVYTNSEWISESSLPFPHIQKSDIHHRYLLLERYTRDTEESRTNPYKLKIINNLTINDTTTYETFNTLKLIEPLYCYKTRYSINYRHVRSDIDYMFTVKYFERLNDYIQPQIIIDTLNEKYNIPRKLIKNQNIINELQEVKTFIEDFLYILSDKRKITKFDFSSIQTTKINPVITKLDDPDIYNKESIDEIKNLIKSYSIESILFYDQSLQMINEHIQSIIDIMIKSINGGEINRLNERLFFRKEHSPYLIKDTTPISDTYTTNIKINNQEQANINLSEKNQQLFLTVEEIYSKELFPALPTLPENGVSLNSLITKLNSSVEESVSAVAPQPQLQGNWRTRFDARSVVAADTREVAADTRAVAADTGAVAVDTRVATSSRYQQTINIETYKTRLNYIINIINTKVLTPESIILLMKSLVTLEEEITNENKHKQETYFAQMSKLIETRPEYSDIDLRFMDWEQDFTYTDWEQYNKRNVLNDIVLETTVDEPVLSFDIKTFDDTILFSKTKPSNIFKQLKNDTEIKADTLIENIKTVFNMLNDEYDKTDERMRKLLDSSYDAPDKFDTLSDKIHKERLEEERLEKERLEKTEEEEQSKREAEELQRIEEEKSGVSFTSEQMAAQRGKPTHAQNIAAKQRQREERDAAKTLRKAEKAARAKKVAEEEAALLGSLGTQTEMVPKLEQALTEKTQVKTTGQQSLSAFESGCNIVLSDRRDKESRELLDERKSKKHRRPARDSKSTPLVSVSKAASSEGMERPSEALMAPRVELDTTHGNVKDLWSNIEEAKEARDTAKFNFEKAYLAYYKKDVDDKVLKRAERALEGDIYVLYIKYKGMIETVKRLNKQFAKATLQKANEEAEKIARKLKNKKSNKKNRFVGGSYNNIEHQIKILSPSLKLKNQYLKYKNKYLKLKQKLGSKYTDIKYTIEY